MREAGNFEAIERRFFRLSSLWYYLSLHVAWSTTPRGKPKRERAHLRNNVSPHLLCKRILPNFGRIDRKVGKYTAKVREPVLISMDCKDEETSSYYSNPVLSNSLERI